MIVIHTKMVKMVMSDEEFQPASIIKFIAGIYTKNRIPEYIDNTIYVILYILIS